MWHYCMDQMTHNSHVGWYYGACTRSSVLCGGSRVAGCPTVGNGRNGWGSHWSAPLVQLGAQKP